jgi:hypothetical protein
MNDALILVAAAVAAVLLIMLCRWLSRQLGPRRPAPQPFVGDPNNDKLVTVRGWQPETLSTILRDFAKMYDLPPTFAVTAPRAVTGTMALSFPSDLPSDTFFFLVNYLHYPIDQDLSAVSVAAVGSVTLTAAFGVPEPSLVGKRALVYIPDRDEDYDVVYVEVAAGGAYAVPFTNLRWQRAESPRHPPWLHEL